MGQLPLRIIHPLKRRSSSSPTLQIIADQAGVSRVTVSHILGGKFADRYKETTRIKVHELAKELNYHPNRAAQAIKTGHSNLVAIVHFGMGIEAAYRTNLALARMVSGRGYEYLAVDMNWHGNSVDRTLSEIIRSRAEGVLISHMQEVFQEKHIRELQGVGIPVVAVNGSRRSNIPLVCDHAEAAICQITKHLIDLGKRSIIHLGPRTLKYKEETARSPVVRSRGFNKAICEAGRHLHISEDDFFENRSELLGVKRDGMIGIHVEQDPELYVAVDRPAYRFARRLFSGGALPDAIMCQNDRYAIEVFAAALECGVRIPDQVAVTGYDNDYLSSFPAFGVTTAEQDTEAICGTAVDILFKRILQNEEVDNGTLAIPSKLIIRTSCGSSVVA